MQQRRTSRFARHIAAFVLAFGAVALIGCGNEEQSASNGETPGETPEWKQDLEAARENLSDAGRKFADQVSDQFSTLTSDVTDLRERAEANSDQLGQRWQQLRQELDTKLTTAKEKIGNLADAGADQWDQASAEAGKAIEELNQAYQRAADYVDSQVNGQSESQTQQGNGGNGQSSY